MRHDFVEREENPFKRNSSGLGQAKPSAGAAISRRRVLTGLFSTGAVSCAATLGLAGCNGFFISSTTTTTLTSSTTNATFGASITLTATVVSTSATGTVTFYDGTTQLGTATLTSGIATYPTSSLADGTHTLTAVYGGDTTYNGSTSAVITVVISAALTSTTTSLASSTTSTSAGMSVVLTATVSESAATGTVQFFDGATQLGASAVSAAVATFTTTTLAVGTHILTAVYVGDSSYTTSTSGAVTVVIT